MLRHYSLIGYLKFEYYLYFITIFLIYDLSKCTVLTFNSRYVLRGSCWGFACVLYCSSGSKIMLLYTIYYSLFCPIRSYILKNLFWVRVNSIQKYHLPKFQVVASVVKILRWWISQSRKVISYVWKITYLLLNMSNYIKSITTRTDFTIIIFLARGVFTYSAGCAVYTGADKVLGAPVVALLLFSYDCTRVLHELDMSLFFCISRILLLFFSTWLPSSTKFFISIQNGSTFSW